MDTLQIVFLIVVGILALPLLFVVHVVLERSYLAYAFRFCKKRGLMVQRFRKQRCAESSFIELDCLDHEQRRRLVRLVVWIFGVRAVLSIEDFSDEPVSHPPQGAEGLMTREQFFANREAWSRDHDWVNEIGFVALIVLAFASLPMFKYVDRASDTVQGIVGVAGTIFFVGFYAIFCWRSNRRLRRHGLECPGCRKPLVGDRECERLVAHTGQCWRCGAWVFTQ
jgi:hypothetical protein